MALSSTSYGKLAEHLAVTELLRRGHAVAIPVADDDGVDLVVNYRWRVQVKNATRLGQRTNSVDDRDYVYDRLAWNSKRQWSEADFFLLHGDGRWFVLPREALAGWKPSVGLHLAQRRSDKAEVLLAHEDAWHLFDV